MNTDLVLERFNHEPTGTFGRLMFPTGETFFTVEREWNNNVPFESCIPPGLYYLEKRESNVVRQTSAGEFHEGWEIMDVIGRDDCMIHPANWPSDLAGCIGVGLDYTVAQDRKGKWRTSVLRSRQAFREIMTLLDQSNHWTLDIRPFLYSWP